jgi:hypothetical protein
VTYERSPGSPRLILVRWYTVAAVAALVLLAAGALIVIVGPRTVFRDVTTIGWPHQFSVEQWQQHPDERYYMAFDLAGSSTLRGKTEIEVRQMLGAPSFTLSGRWTWNVAYPHGPGDGLVVFLQNGKVAAWDVLTDGETSPSHH